MEAERILVVEDDLNTARVLTRLLQKEGYHCDYVPTAEEALSLLPEAEYDLLLIDLVLPGMNGLTFLKKAKEIVPDLLTLIITAYGSITSAVEALKAGADDFLEKPLVPEKLFHILRKTFEEQRLRREVRALRKKLARRYRFANIVGKHPAMQKIFALIESLRDTDSAVLITGETGTGKDLVARAIHFNSRRRHRPFVAINCAAVPEPLLESELFGYERGAFTGAVKQKKGKLEQAEGGTVFLDEIGDMPLSIQGKLLRTIQEKKVERLGSTQSLSLDIRIISATNKDLVQAIAQNRFRMDLFYRINVVPIHIPPLRERPEDIPLLVNHLLEKLAKQNGRPAPRLTEQALSRLMSHSWPGNVRELENLLERALITSPGERIDEKDLPFTSVMIPPAGMSSVLSQPSSFAEGEHSLKEVRDQAVAKAEQEYLTYLLTRYKGSIKETAAHAKTDVRTIRRKMKAYGLDKWDFK